MTPQCGQIGPFAHRRFSSQARALASSVKIGFWRSNMAKSFLKAWCESAAELLGQPIDPLVDEGNGSVALHRADKLLDFVLRETEDRPSIGGSDELPLDQQVH